MVSEQQRFTGSQADVPEIHRWDWPIAEYAPSLRVRLQVPIDEHATLRKRDLIAFNGDHAFQHRLDAIAARIDL